MLVVLRSLYFKCSS